MNIAEKLQTVAENQQKVYDAGYAAGQSAGGNTDEAYQDGFADGKLAEYDAFWDVLQQKGNRRNYWGAFASWTDEIFKPKYPIVATAIKSMFYLSTITQLPTMDFSGGIYALENTFDYTSVITIEKIIIKADGTQRINQGFTGCRKLVNVSFEGVIGASISFADCSLLSKASIENVVGVLSNTTTGTTATFNKAAVNNAFTTDEWNALVATKPNWTVTLV